MHCGVVWCGLPQVLALCTLCVAFFLLRGTLNLVSVFGLLPKTSGGMPFMDPVSGEHTEASIIFDVVRAPQRDHGACVCARAEARLSGGWGSGS